MNPTIRDAGSNAFPGAGSKCPGRSTWRACWCANWSKAPPRGCREWFCRTTKTFELQQLGTWRGQAIMRSCRGFVALKEKTRGHSAVNKLIAIMAIAFLFVASPTHAQKIDLTK